VKEVKVLKRRCEEQILEETDERISMDATTEKEYPIKTSEDVAGRSEPAMPEDVGLHPDVSAMLQMNVNPQIK
jgi:hypothetical protein